MLNSFFQAICRVGIFMICAQAIMHFKAKESYEKYLKLLVSTMILIQLFLPIGNFFAGKSGLQAEDVLEQFKREVEQGMKTAEENAAAADAILEQMTLEEIRNYMEQPAEENGGKKDENGGLEEENSDGESVEKMSKEDGGKSGGGEKKNEGWENGGGEENKRREYRGGDEENQEEKSEDGKEENKNSEGENSNRIEIEVEEIEPISIRTPISEE